MLDVEILVESWIVTVSVGFVETGVEAPIWVENSVLMESVIVSIVEPIEEVMIFVETTSVSDEPVDSVIVEEIGNSVELIE